MKNNLKMYDIQQSFNYMFAFETKNYNANLNICVNCPNNKMTKV
jgi:hypothetical protein